MRYFSDVKFDKHTMENCFHNGHVTFFSFICGIGVSEFTLPLNIPDNSSNVANKIDH